MFGKQKPLAPRPENEPKFNADNQSDRALLRTLVLLMGIVLILLVAGVAIYLFFF